MTARIVLLIVAIVLLAACSKKPEDKPVDSGDQGPTTGKIQDSNTNASNVDPFTDPSNPLSTLVIYFDYNSSSVTDINAVNAHGDYLSQNPGAKVRLEGHADERGSREYNIALSERRALEVKRLMLLRGASAGQIDTLAFGEEKPVEFGSSESSYAKNRRVEIAYEAK